MLPAGSDGAPVHHVCEPVLSPAGGPTLPNHIEIEIPIAGGECMLGDILVNGQLWSGGSGTVEKGDAVEIKIPLALELGGGVTVKRAGEQRPPIPRNRAEAWTAFRDPEDAAVLTLRIPPGVSLPDTWAGVIAAAFLPHTREQLAGELRQAARLVAKNGGVGKFDVAAILRHIALEMDEIF